MTTTKKIAFAGLGMAAIAAPMFSTTASAASVVTSTYQTTASTNVRTGPSTSNSIAATLPSGTKVSGVVTNGWVKLTSPSNLAGKYMSTSVMKFVSSTTSTTSTSTTPSTPVVTAPSTSVPTPTVNSGATITAKNVTRYTGVQYANYPYASRSASASHGAAVVPLTPISGNLYSDGSFVATSGTYAGKTFFHTLASNPYNSYETRQWQDVSGVQATAPTSATVTRYVVTNRVQAPLHSSAAYGTGNISNRISSGTALSGHYVNSHWFQITSGSYAGKYISSGIIFTGSSQAAVNGKLGGNDLCTVPSAMRQTSTSNSQFMGCEALQQLIKADAGMSAASGTHVKEWEAYRTLATQQQYYRLYGSPQAAVPGTSNHGLGVAMDMNYGGTLTWASTQVKNMTKYGPAYGWVKPTYLLPSGSWNGEPWHYEFNG